MRRIGARSLNKAWRKAANGCACGHLEHSQPFEESPTASHIGRAQKLEVDVVELYVTRMPDSAEISSGGTLTDGLT